VLRRLKRRRAPLGDEDVAVALYLREGARWYVQLSVRSTIGASVAWGVVEILEAATDADLGAAVRRALARAPRRPVSYRIDDSRETPWSREGKSFRAFARAMALVEVCRRPDRRFSVEPYENRVFTRPPEGFVGITERVRVVEDDDEQLGAAMRAAAVSP
jgi:hypothetical protein